MPILDIFRDDAFSQLELTRQFALDEIDYKPMFLGQLGIFEFRPIRTRAAAYEKRGETLSLIPVSGRTDPYEQREKGERDLRYFPTRRLAKADTVYAEEVQDMREFGESDQLTSLMAEVARRQRLLVDDMELTWEYHRLGAIQGIVLDADGVTEIDNWFDHWGIQQPQEIDFELGDADTDVRKKSAEVVRAMRRAAKGAWTPATQAHALCGDEFFDALVQHPSVRDTYLGWAAAQDVRGNLAFESFPFGGVMYHNYRGTDDNETVAVAPEAAKFFPVGSPGTFQHVASPAPTADAVNTPGEQLYTRIILDEKRQEYVEVETHCYPLFVCTRPQMLQRATSGVTG